MTYFSVTDFDIQALLDNELDWEEEKRVRDYIHNNPNAMRRYKQLYDQKKALQRWGRQEGDEPDLHPTEQPYKNKPYNADA